MEITVYKNNNADNFLTKNLTEIATFLDARFTETVDMMDVRILLSMNESVLSANYLYIPKLKRYYFIRDIIINNAKQLTLICHVDVLMTFNEDVKTMDAIIERNAIENNYYVPDNQYPALAKRQVVTKNFPSGFTKQGCYILTIGGD